MKSGLRGSIFAKSESAASARQLFAEDRLALHQVADNIQRRFFQRLSRRPGAQQLIQLRRNLTLGLRRDERGAVPKTSFDLLNAPPVASVDDLVSAMAAVQEIYVSEVFIKHAVELVRRTRRHRLIEVGASPRAGIALTLAARARAFIHGRDYAIP